uniref:Uncharacterized protein n=1 Tax=Steinernema glaseri TaxID=37863 RepID=A0A1I8A4T9_9BILA
MHVIPLIDDCTFPPQGLTVYCISIGILPEEFRAGADRLLSCRERSAHAHSAHFLLPNRSTAMFQFLVIAYFSYLIYGLALLPDAADNAPSADSHREKTKNEVN